MRVSYSPIQGSGISGDRSHGRACAQALLGGGGAPLWAGPNSRPGSAGKPCEGVRDLISAPGASSPPCGQEAGPAELLAVVWRFCQKGGNFWRVWKHWAVWRRRGGGQDALAASSVGGLGLGLADHGRRGRGPAILLRWHPGGRAGRRAPGSACPPHAPLPARPHRGRNCSRVCPRKRLLTGNGCTSAAVLLKFCVLKGGAGRTVSILES